MNGKQVYPATGFTDLYFTPYKFQTTLNSEDIVIGSTNTIEIIAGQTTLPVKVNLTNKEGMDIKNLKVELHAPIYHQTQIQLSKTENSFIPEQVLTFTDIQKRDENVSFYVRIVTNADDVAHSGEFDIYAEAVPASES
ncbi:hypothetical protein [Brevibacillus laterosporus]|uniref:hypothetical protein n=1 Tax=Brevibacillus laterosporus TaxID=1465 RepID=UPI0018F86FB0|nr:hypothetical protein [Brevibacillus laterosporus]MBG9774865.1 hypothetical protein [Brevibacillus laterosporus]